MGVRGDSVMKLTPQQKTRIVDSIVYSINESQSSDYYDFDELTITWVEAQERYMVESNGDNDWASPKDIVCYIKDLSDRALVDWFCFEEGIEQSELAEFVEETA
jgi:hypothetical protein